MLKGKQNVLIQKKIKGGQDGFWVVFSRAKSDPYQYLWPINVFNVQIELRMMCEGLISQCSNFFFFHSECADGLCAGVNLQNTTPVDYTSWVWPRVWLFCTLYQWLLQSYPSTNDNCAIAICCVKLYKTTTSFLFLYWHSLNNCSKILFSKSPLLLTPLKLLTPILLKTSIVLSLGKPIFSNWVTIESSIPYNAESLTSTAAPVLPSPSDFPSLAYNFVQYAAVSSNPALLLK